MNKKQINSHDLGKARQGMELAMRLVSITYTVPLDELFSPTRRKAKVAFARQVAMYLVHVGMGMNLSQVAKLFKRDRSTAAHACRLIEDFRDNEEFDELVDLLEKTLRTLYHHPAAIPSLRGRSLMAKSKNASLRLHS